MVPEKGLEPPHACAYMDLNHACLPFHHSGTQRFRSEAMVYDGFRRCQVFFGAEQFWEQHTA